MPKPCKIKFQQWKCHIIFAQYVNGGRAIQLLDARDGEPVATATVWLPGLQPDEVAIKDYSENEGMLEALLKAKVVQPPHRHINSGFIVAPVCRFTEAYA